MHMLKLKNFSPMLAIAGKKALLCNLYFEGENMGIKPEILNCETIATSRLFKIEQLNLQFSNGEKRTYERLAGGKSRGAVIILPLLSDDTFLLIREYAAGTDRYELGLPKGLVEKNESIFEAANRELKEEIHYGAKELHEIKTFSVAPGYINAETHLILAKSLFEESLPGDEPEEIEVIPWKLDNVETLFRRDDFTEARSIAAVL